MSRSGYSDDCDYGGEWAQICWRGAVTSALRGKRGQAFLRELAEAMDAMPVKRLIAGELEHAGEFCTLGVIGAARGLDMSNIDPDDACIVAEKFNIAQAMAREIVWENDGYPGTYIEGKGWRTATPEERWMRMRDWVAKQLEVRHDQQAE